MIRFLNMRVAALSMAFVFGLACDRGADGAADGAPGAVASVRPDRVQLSVGDNAPQVMLRLQDGKQVALNSLKGQQVVVYFYPKDDTPGCTLEAQGIRDDYAAFESANVRVFGVSLQDAASHLAFIDKHDLPFDLVVDGGGEVAKAFGVPMRGDYAARQTFLIGADGKVKQVWRDVDPESHSKQLLAAIAE